MNSKYTLKTELYRFDNSEKISNNGASYVLFCDEVPKQIGNSQAIQIIEKAINSKLAHLSSEKLTEMNLTAALQFANSELLDYNQTNKTNALVSAVLVALNPIAFDSETNIKGAELIIAGLGDCRIYQVDSEELTLSFYDPRNPFRTLYVSPQKRLISLENVLGKKPNIQVLCRRIFKSQSQRYLIASCGCYQQATQQELLSLGTDTGDLSQAMSAFFSHCSSKENDLKMMMISLENSLSKESPAPKKPSTSTISAKKTKTPFLVGAALVALGLAGTLFYQNTHKNEGSVHAKNDLLQAIQNQSQMQTELILSLKNEIDMRNSELKELRNELSKTLSHSKLAKKEQASRNFDEASKIIEDLRRLLKEKQEEATQLAKNVATELSSNLDHTATAALQTVNSQLTQQYEKLHKFYAQQRIEKNTLAKAVGDIKSSLSKQARLLASAPERAEQSNEEANKLQKLIIELQQSMLNQIEQAKKQIAKRLEELKKAATPDNET